MAYILQDFADVGKSLIAVDVVFRVEEVVLGLGADVLIDLVVGEERGLGVYNLWGLAGAEGFDLEVGTRMVAVG